MAEALDSGALLTMDYFEEFAQWVIDDDVRDNDITDEQVNEFMRRLKASARAKMPKRIFNAVRADDFVWERLTDIIDTEINQFVDKKFKKFVKSIKENNQRNAINPDADVELNSHHVNAAIQFHELDEESMEKAGFKRISGDRWYYCRTLHYKHLDVSFNVSKEPDDDLNIMVLDEAFCQPYDYQYMEAQGNINEYTQATRKFVEKQMKYLQDLGILSGHKPGEYI